MLYLERENAPALACHYTPPAGGKPVVMFCGGFMSDMAGTKAMYLEQRCTEERLGFIRFDYSGHGASGGAFTDGTIGGWTRDALFVLDRLAPAASPVILAGSSMGGWISFLVARERPRRVAGIVGIAAAPDFTRRIQAELTPDRRQALATDGFFREPNDYGDEGYVFTRQLLEEGESHCFLTEGLPLAIPVTLIQGKKDPDVPWRTAEAIKNALPETGARLVYVDDGDHRLSKPPELELIWREIARLAEIVPPEGRG